MEEEKKLKVQVFSASQCGWVKLGNVGVDDVWEKPNGELHYAYKGQEPVIYRYDAE